MVGAAGFELTTLKPQTSALPDATLRHQGFRPFPSIGKQTLACFVTEQTMADLPQLIAGGRQLVALRLVSPAPFRAGREHLQRVPSHNRHHVFDNFCTPSSFRLRATDTECPQSPAYLQDGKIADLQRASMAG